MRQKSTLGLKAKLLIILLILTFACSIDAEATLATVSISGVAKGDIFYYVMYAQYSSNTLGAPIQVPAFEANNTDWVRIEITGVNGSVVYHVYTLHFKDGSEQNIKGQTDVAINAWKQDNLVFRGIPICPSNLNVGDAIPSVQLTINETVTRNWLGVERQTNHVAWNSSLEFGNCYFDRQTGMLLEMYREHTFVNSVTGESVKKTDIVKMTRSNAWSTDKGEYFFISTLFIAAATCGVSGTMLSHKKKEYNKLKITPYRSRFQASIVYAYCDSLIRSLT